MSNETDLDWLARNVHEWPSQGEAYQIGHAAFKQGALFFRDCVTFDVGFAQRIISVKQWLARRAELQNKPSWESSPEWAAHLSQNSSGEWWWHGDEPTEHSSLYYSSCGKNMVQCKGEVLGDWRDTLERRPDMHKSEPKIDTSAEHVHKTTESMHVSARGNDWFERGELPPVGTVCLYVVSDRLSAEVEITAHAKLGLCFVQVGQSGESYVSKTAELHRFRPIPTERDVLLSIIVEEMNRYDTDGKLADAILAAGFKRGAA